MMTHHKVASGFLLEQCARNAWLPCAGRVDSKYLAPVLQFSDGGGL